MPATTPTRTSRSLALAALAGLLASGAVARAEPAPAYDRERALAISQAAIGNRLGDYALTDSEGRTVRLTDFAGKPLLVSLVFTSCYHSCPVTTKRLRQAVAEARDALGADSFAVVTVGFDVANDTPERMRVFGREQGIDPDGWTLLSATPEVIPRLLADVGFVHYPSPRGFDHIAQVTVVGRDGVVYRQVYGEMFELPQLVEPLKDLVFNRPRDGSPVTASLLDRIKLFCTVYDPTTGRYDSDYSLFVEVFVGLLVLLSVAGYLVHEARKARS